MVTVSATYGAGGSVVAPLLAERLGLPFADRLLAGPGGSQGPGVAPATERDRDPAPRSALLESLGLVVAEWGVPAQVSSDDRPGRVQAEVEASLRDLLEVGGAVVLGRAAAVPLAGHPRVFHVRLDGPVERRAERGARWDGVDLATARQHLRETDAARARYVKRLYRRDPGDPTLYHLVLDSTVLAPDPLVEVVAGAAEAFWRTDDDRGSDEVRTRAHQAAQRSRRPWP